MTSDAEATKLAEEYELQNRSGTRVVSQHLLTFIPPITASSVVHDNASAAGTVTSEILNLASPNEPAQIYATDISPLFIRALELQISEQQWSNVTASVADSTDLSAVLADGSVSHSITNFGIFLFPDPQRAGREIFRTLEPGGTVVLTTWKVHGAIDMAHWLQQQINPDAPLFPPKVGPMETWKDERNVRRFLEEQGFERI